MANQALIIIDIQNDYFAGGAMELHQPVEAANKAAKLIEHFRASNLPVIHIQQLSLREELGFLLPGTKGQEIHPSVEPLAGEKVVVKHFPNAFAKTDLIHILEQMNVSDIVVAGMMTHMCVSSTIRAALEYGLKTTVAHDACATRDLEVLGKQVLAEDVHITALAEIAPITHICSSDEIIS
ncbi:cysteine hydrolase family protein [uncultured Vibrio sp.]|uniref:cysteine hydrolase family protein n=1 Tax=uncultured Vibrio sp. TaxID=114054 RepID=UPI0025EFC1A9|nr:cysteine hydrolase family protein [uncultured Vibrio sp.]